MVRAPSNFDHIGLHRRSAIQAGLAASNATHFLYIDLDHLLRWFENDVSELSDVVRQISAHDFSVIGRGQQAFTQLPERLSTTESIVNRIYTLVTGDDWDLLMAARGMSRQAAQVVVHRSTIDHIGNDLDWPLLCRANGYQLHYVEADGLTYETEKNYGEGRVDQLDLDAEAWATRVDIAALHVSAIRPYMTTGHSPQ
ncbi:MAG: hypothetical protein AAF525_14945 [Pseudomonadota bacterium]